MAAMPTVAVLGAGRIGCVHIENLQKLGARVLVVEPDERRRQVVGPGLGCPLLPDVAVLPGVDGAVVCAPTPRHEAVVRDLLRLSVPLLVEKPLTGQPAASVALGAEADARGVPLRIGFQRRFSPEFVLLKSAYSRRAAPAGWALFVSLDGRGPPEHYATTAGSLAFDMQIHDIDLILWLFGQPVTQVAAVQSDDCPGGRPGQLVTTLVLGDGPVCSAVCRRTNPGGCQVFATLVGPREILDTRDLRPEPFHEDFRSRFAPAYLEEARQFLRLVSGQDDALAGWRDAVAAEEVCRWVDVVAVGARGVGAGA